MGRHAAPEPEAATVEIATWRTEQPQREVDLPAWWARTKPNTKVWLVMGAVAASALGVGAVASASSGHATSSSPTWDARMQGWSYGAELRDAGYNSASVIANCSINGDGYGGSYWDDYRNGCVGVALQMMDHGR